MYTEDAQMGPRLPTSEDLMMDTGVSPPVERPLYIRQKDLRLRIMRVLALTALAVTAFAACYLVFGWEAIYAFLQESWPILIAPFAGFAMGYWSAKVLYRPFGCLVVCAFPETHTMRIVFIPDALFRFFTQTGNNVVYHTPRGMPVYIARDIDTDNGSIIYSWIHERDALIVLTREEAFVNWRQACEDILRENMQIIDIPYIIGLGYTRGTMKRVLDGFAEVLGLKERDFAKDTTVETPEPQEAAEDERGHRLHQRDGARPDHSRRFGEAG